jgi:CubicO group peptidase (beta-lactamase class C family)
MKQLLAFTLLLFSITAQAQVVTSKPSVLTAAPPAAAGMNATRLARIDSLMQEYINKQWTAGAVAIVVKDGKIVYYKSFGNNDGSTKTPVQKDDIFRIASQTKAITSVGIMMLYEEGKLSLDDAVSKYIPEFKNPKVLDKFNSADTTYTTVSAKREITIRDLLTHTSGIDYAQIGSPKMTAIYAKAGVVGGIGVDNIVLGDKMKILGSLPLIHQPGEKWTYGLNTDLLGYLIEVVSGQLLDAYFRTRIFEPLGMKDTYFYLPVAKRSRLATLYTENNEKKVVKAPASFGLNGDVNTNYPATDGTYFSGGGGLSSTAYDYAIFMQMLLNDGIYNGQRILSPKAARLMHTNQIGQIPFGGNNFGLGFEIVSEANAGKNMVSPGSYSWGGMFSSTYWIDPAEKIVAQLFLNQYPNSHGEIHSKFQTLVYAAIEN